MAEKAKTKKSNKKSTGLGLALWILCALILLVVFLVNQARIVNNLKQTGFFERTMGKTPAFVENAKVKEPVSDKNDVAPVESVEIDLNYNSAPVISDSIPGPKVVKEQEREESVKQEIQKPVDTKKEAPAIREEKKESKPETKETITQKPAEVKKEAPVKKETVVTAPAKPQTMRIKLYFMTISSNGSVARREVVREMKKSDSPLVDAVNALISGPNATEENSGCRSLVSTGTRLIGASVKNGVALLNFSSEFEFNQFGIEGTRGQLQQIVYTATAFPTVESVQFLVDGDKKEYLGSEGVWIGTPLNRNSF